MDDKEIQALLFDAIQHDNETFLDDLLASEQGKSLLDLPDNEGNMLLHVAVLDNRPKCIDCLLKHGANPNVFDTNRSRTPLHLAIELGHGDIVRKFLSLEHINLSLHDDRNLTCYEIAQLCDNSKLAELIKSRHEEIIQLKDDFYTVINQACSDNNPVMVRELLEGQVNNLVNKMKQHSSSNTKDHVLFAHSRIKELINWSSSSRNDVTLLFKSASRGFTDVCEVLIEYGATAKCNENTNYSPLYVAAYSGHTDTVRLLLNSFPSLITEVTIERWTILHACCLQGHSETASLILNYPYPDELKRTFSYGSGSYEYKFAFDLNAQDAAGQTVVFLAVSANNEKLLDTLLQFKVEAMLIEAGDVKTNVNNISRLMTNNFDKNVVSDELIDMRKVSIIPDRPKLIIETYDKKSKNLTSKPNRQISEIIKQLQKSDHSDSLMDPKSDYAKSAGKKYLVCPFDLDTYCDYNSKTALHLAVIRMYHKIATAILVNGSDPNLPILAKSANGGRNNDLRQDYPSSYDLASISSQETTDSTSWARISRSTCLREACRANDNLMCDILIRYGSRDVNNLALQIAASNDNDELISKLLALNSNIDHDYKINKKCNVEFASRYKQIRQVVSNNSHVGNITTFSSMFPSSPVIIDWHNVKYIKRIDPQWLIEASLNHNKRLKDPTTSLMAITRLDLSSNGLKFVHPVIFRLPSLRELNLSKNRLESLSDFTHRVSTDDKNSIPTQKLIESHRVAMKRSKSANLSSINLESSNAIDLDEPLEWDLPFLESLDLHDNLLISLPDYLFKLPKLKDLDVSSNQIRQLPSSLWSAPSLKDVSASGNLLDDLPRFMTPSSSECSIISDKNQYVPESSFEDESVNYDKKSEINSITTSQYTKDNNNDNSFLLELDDYTEYQLESCQIHMNHPNYWKERVELISSKQRSSLNNKTFDENASSDGDRNDCNGIIASSKLSSLNLSHNSFSSIPPVLACVATELLRLNLSHNRLQFTSEIYLYPSKLKTLDLSHNQITCWSWSRSSLSPDKTKRLCHASLNRGINVYDCYHKSHNRLDNLKSLNLSHNMLTELCLYSSTIGDLETISGQDIKRRMSLSPNSDNVIGSNKAKQFQDVLAYPNVTTFDLSSNKLRQIPKQISNLKDLSVLNLSGNISVCNLPPELGLASKLWNLGLNGCCLSEPLKSIVESKTYKTMDVIGYLRSILEESKPYARMKLMLVGLQGIGKTSLLEQLRNEGSSGGMRRKIPEHWTKRMGHTPRSNLKNQRGVTLSTVGIDIHDWVYNKRTTKNQKNLGPISFSTWDFGGQEEFYATHRYFLSKRSLYLVVWRLTDGINGILGIEQWLVNIQSRASGSPVVIVGTHEDLIEGGVNGDTVKDLQYEIHKRFIDVSDYDKCGLPRVMSSLVVSIKTRLNIKLLCDRIYDVAFSLKCPGTSDRLLEQKIPATYLYLEEIVNSIVHERHQKRKEPVLTYYEYRRLASDQLYARYNKTFRDLEQLNSKELNYNSEFQQANRFLHENGVLLHYEDANLRDLYFLDPQWLCDILSHVVTIREINPHVKCGLMKIDDLGHLFRSLDINMNGGVKSYVVNLLNKFEVALTWNSQYLLIPSLLPTDPRLINTDARSSDADSFQVRVAPRARGRSAVRRYDAVGHSKRSSSIEPSHKRNSLTPSIQLDDDNDPSKTKTTRYRLEIDIQQMQTVHRLILLKYLPAGFFSRLQSGLLSDVKFEEICTDIQMNLIDHLPDDIAINSEVVDQIGSRPGWTCWRNGIRLSLQRDSTINSPIKPNELINHLISIEELKTSNASSSIIDQTFMVESAQSNNSRGNEKQAQSSTTINNDSKSASHQKGDSVSSVEVIKSKWCQLNLNEYSNILVVSVPSWRLKITKEPNQLGSCKHFVELDKQFPAQLLAFAVDHIDNLLEDWYPSLGARFAHTLGGNYLVTRIAPCINCFNATRNFYNDSTNQFSGRQSRHSRQARIMTTNRINPFSTLNTNFGSANANLKSIFDKQQSSIHSYYVERCILAAYNIDNDIGSSDNTEHQQLREKHRLFTVHNRPKSALELLHCPKHGYINLATIAPDIVFDDLANDFKIDGDQIDRCKLIGRGTFGFVFKGTIRNNSNTISHQQQEVALKVLEPVDPGPEAEHGDLLAYKLIKSNWLREPFECVCRSYCTARHEVNILLSVSHPNLVHFIGLCLKPLAVILELAPMGSLADIFKSYKRSAMRIDQWSAQKTIFQVAKALQFLHQQRIIYRDLKSENVLVWQFPSPFAINFEEASIEVKLADYGISRRALSTGIWKGFAGTINFLAPEILRHNGDEEYTDKVDCFSFGMFMYELLTLKSPFKHSEGFRSRLTEGVKPTLTNRDLGYPNYMLDLMTVCWSYEPLLRPTSSQIVTIASTPEFMHLYDVVTLDEPTNKITFCQAIQYYDDESNQGGSNSLDLWLGRNRFNIDIISTDLNYWSEYLRLYDRDANTESESSIDYDTQPTAMCLVGGRVWMCDSNLNMHIMPLIPRLLKQQQHKLPSKYNQLINENQQSTRDDLCSGVNRVQTFSLDFSSIIDESARAGCYVEQMIDVVSANCIIIVRNDKPLTSRLFILNLDTMKLARLDDNCLKINCIAVSTHDDNRHHYDQHNCSYPADEGAQFKIFCGHLNGISCMEIRDNNIFRQKILNLSDKSVDLTGEQVLDPSQSAEINHIVVNKNLIWTAAGCTVHLWSYQDQCIARKLDCWKLVPCSESLESINIEQYYEQSRSSRVSSMVYLNEQLFVGTDHGCFMVVEAPSLKPIIVFRPYEKSITILKPLMVNTNKIYNRTNESTSSDGGSLGSLENNNESVAAQYLVTIGVGYRDLMSRYVSSLNDSLEQSNYPHPVYGNSDTNNLGQVAILWSANYHYQL